MSPTRWLVFQGSHDDGRIVEWDPVGSVTAMTSEDAIANARTGWHDLQEDAELRAVSWESATPAERAAADYEDNMRAASELGDLLPVSRVVMLGVATAVATEYPDIVRRVDPGGTAGVDMRLYVGYLAFLFSCIERYVTALMRESTRAAFLASVQNEFDRMLFLPLAGISSPGEQELRSTIGGAFDVLRKEFLRSDHALGSDGGLPKAVFQEYADALANIAGRTVDEAVANEISVNTEITVRRLRLPEVLPR